MSVFTLRDLPKFETIQAHAALYPDMDARAMETYLVLMRVSGDLLDALEAHLARHEISSGRFTVLMLLKKCSAEGSRAIPSDLADKAGVTRATMTGLLDGLERDRMVTREQDPSDRRTVTIRLTEQGAELLERILPDHFRRISKLMSPLNDQERKTLMMLMIKISQGLPAMMEA